MLLLCARKSSGSEASQRSSTVAVDFISLRLAQSPVCPGGPWVKSPGATFHTGVRTDQVLALTLTTQSAIKMSA